MGVPDILFYKIIMCARYYFTVFKNKKSKKATIAYSSCIVSVLIKYYIDGIRDATYEHMLKNVVSLWLIRTFKSTVINLLVMKVAKGTISDIISLK